MEAHPLSEDDRRYAYAVARRIVRDEHDAQDVAQEALLLAHQHRDSFRGQSSFRTWFYRVVTTTALAHLRAGRRRRHYLDAFEREVPLASRSPEDDVVARELAAAVAAQVAALGDGYRAVIDLRCAELSDREIADRLAISVAAVKVRAHRARSALREMLVAAA